MTQEQDFFHQSPVFPKLLKSFFVFITQIKKQHCWHGLFQLCRLPWAGVLVAFKGICSVYKQLLVFCCSEGDEYPQVGLVSLMDWNIVPVE